MTGGRACRATAEASPLLFCFPARAAPHCANEDQARPVFVVMSTAATEAETLGVKSRILAEGLTPYEHVADGETLLAVVGELGARREALMGQLAALPGVERVTPI